MIFLETPYFDTNTWNIQHKEIWIIYNTNLRHIHISMILDIISKLCFTGWILKYLSIVFCTKQTFFAQTLFLFFFFFHCVDIFCRLRHINLQVLQTNVFPSSFLSSFCFPLYIHILQVHLTLALPPHLCKYFTFTLLIMNRPTLKSKKFSSSSNL